MYRSQIVSFDEDLVDEEHSEEKTSKMGCWSRFTKIFKDPRYSLGTDRLSSSDQSSSTANNEIYNRSVSVIIEKPVESYVPAFTINDDLKQMSIDCYDNMGYFLSDDLDQSSEPGLSNFHKGSMPDSRRVSVKPCFVLSQIEEEDDVSSISEQDFQTNRSKAVASPNPSQVLYIFRIVKTYFVREYSTFFMRINANSIRRA